MLFFKTMADVLHNAAGSDWPWAPLQEESGCSSVDFHSQYYSRSLSDLLEWCELLVLTQTHASGLHWPERGNKNKFKQLDKAEHHNEIQRTDKQKKHFLDVLDKAFTSRGNKRSTIQEKN